MDVATMRSCKHVREPVALSAHAPFYVHSSPIQGGVNSVLKLSCIFEHVGR